MLPGNDLTVEKMAMNIAMDDLVMPVDRQSSPCYPVADTRDDVAAVCERTAGWVELEEPGFVGCLAQDSMDSVQRLLLDGLWLC